MFDEDRKALAKYHMNVFFKDKKGKDGELLDLDDPYYVNIVMNTDVCSGMEKIYALIGDDSGDDEVPNDVQYVLSLLKICAKKKIPKDFRNGIILLYLEMK